MEAPTALDLYKLHDHVRGMELALRALVQIEGGTHGEWGAIRSLEQACYYLFGAAGWMIQDMTPEAQAQLAGELEAVLEH